MRDRNYDYLVNDYLSYACGINNLTDVDYLTAGELWGPFTQIFICFELLGISNQIDIYRNNIKQRIYEMKVRDLGTRELLLNIFKNELPERYISRVSPPHGSFALLKFSAIMVCLERERCRRYPWSLNEECKELFMWNRGNLVGLSIISLTSTKKPEEKIERETETQYDLFDVRIEDKVNVRIEYENREQGVKEGRVAEGDIISMGKSSKYSRWPIHGDGELGDPQFVLRYNHWKMDLRCLSRASPTLFRLDPQYKYRIQLNDCYYLGQIHIFQVSLITHGSTQERFAREKAVLFSPVNELIGNSVIRLKIEFIHGELMGRSYELPNSKPFYMGTGDECELIFSASLDVGEYHTKILHEAGVGWIIKATNRQCYTFLRVYPDTYLTIPTKISQFTLQAAHTLFKVICLEIYITYIYIYMYIRS